MKFSGLSCLRGTAKPTAHGRHKKVSAPVGRETGGTASDEADTTAAAAAAAAATTVPVSQHKKAPADRRQRLQAEEDCLVLSPQRRSFTTGCQAPPSAKSDDAADR
ncbi:hypothetical protein FJT64_019884 [Amphibalanus amphitrite]|uniref:Uncharacterized protein n=1 Tax=Amphibalanus amphitrite TaxID=1232801 RepID=A0A6A4WNL0_AMPAM|nr:hypothetical protein FJT64_019884 [Amphibalanus amphitrite]